MAEQSLAEQVKSDLQNLQSTMPDLQTSARLTDILDRVEDFGTAVKGLGQRIKSLREGGYAFEKGLEEQAAYFQKEWTGIMPGVKAQIEKEARDLERVLRPLETQLSQLVGEGGPVAAKRARVAKLKSEVETFEGRAEAAERNIRSGYDQFNNDVNKLEYHLSKLEWTLTEINEATFELLATESAIMAVKAVWAKSGKQTKTDPEGVLYLTDQRLLFEQKEKVATKKVLFVTTEKKKVQELLWEVPVDLIEEVKSSKEGFLNKDDYLELLFASRAPYDVVHLHIWHPGDDWKALLKRAKAKEFDKNRAIPIDKAVAQKVKDAPSECPDCGGAINQVILRGMDNITCEFCGVVIRL